MPLSLQEPTTSSDFFRDGFPDIFKALDWRSRLTSLYGRSEQYNCLLNWALKSSANTIEIMLVSGPGGSGKSRLVADVVSVLVNKHDWSGGFLQQEIASGDVIDGGGKGVALIIDYPEERFELVKEILSAATSDSKYDRPVKIILVSRENLNAWKEILNRPHLSRFEEIMIGASPYLDIEDALQITEDVSISYPKRLGCPKSEFRDVEKWLDKHYSHRLPLMTLAASVHAVHEPEKAFTLSGEDVLLSLAEIELQRVRSYSERNLKNEKALEKLLALSLFTSTGLSKDTIFSLGKDDICHGLSGNALLEAVQKTPFWQKKTSQKSSHLIRLEPHRLASAFLVKALSLDEPSPALPAWLGGVVRHDNGEFTHLLARIAMDIGRLDKGASKVIEEIAIAMLKLDAGLLGNFQGMAYMQPATFSGEFTAEVCAKLISGETEAEILAPLHNNIAASLAAVRRSEESLKHSNISLRIYRKLAKSNPDSYNLILSTVLVNFSAALIDLGKREEALRAAEEAVMVCVKMMQKPSFTFLDVYSIALDQLANRYSDTGNHGNALKVAQSAVEIGRQLKNQNPEGYTGKLSGFLLTLANRFAKLLRYKEAVEAIAESENLYRELTEIHPELYLENFVLSLNTHANFLLPIGEYEMAFEKSSESVNIYRYLAESRPDAFQPDLAAALIVLGENLIKLQKLEDAVKCQEEAVETYRSLDTEHPQVFSPKLAESILILANLYSKVGDIDKALSHCKVAVELFRDLAAAEPQAFLPKLALSLNNLANRLSAIALFEDALDSAEESVAIYRTLVGDKLNVYAADMAMSLGTLSKRLAQLDRIEEGLHQIQEAIAIYSALDEPESIDLLIRHATELSNLTSFLIELDRYGEAALHAEKSVSIFHQIFELTKNAPQPQMAWSSHILAVVELKLKQTEKASKHSLEAVSGITPFFLRYPNRYRSWMEPIVVSYLKICEISGAAVDKDLVRDVYEKLDYGESD